MTIIRRLILFTFLAAICVPAFSQEEAEVLSFLKSHAPEVHQEMVRLKKEEPDVFAETFAETANARREYLRVSKFDAKGATAYLEMFKIDFDVVGFTDAIAESSDPQEIAQLRVEAKKQIEKSFDYWVIYERARLDHLAAELKQTRANFEADAENKAAIVAHDVEELIKQSREYLKSRKAKSK